MSLPTTAMPFDGFVPEPIGPTTVRPVVSRISSVAICRTKGGPSAARIVNFTGIERPALPSNPPDPSGSVHSRPSAVTVRVSNDARPAPSSATNSTLCVPAVNSTKLETPERRASEVPGSIHTAVETTPDSGSVAADVRRSPPMTVRPSSCGSGVTTGGVRSRAASGRVGNDDVSGTVYLDLAARVRRRRARGSAVVQDLERDAEAEILDKGVGVAGPVDEDDATVRGRTVRVAHDTTVALHRDPPYTCGREPVRGFGRVLDHLSRRAAPDAHLERAPRASDGIEPGLVGIVEALRRHKDG